MRVDDGRKDKAKAIPILEVAQRLRIGGLRRAGVERVGPCPVCGGSDRFSINPARGVWHCRGNNGGCDLGGDALALAQHVLGCDFQGVLDFLVDKADVAPDPAELARRKAAAEAAEDERREYEERARARAIRDAREIWHAAAPGAGTLAEQYLAARGIVFPRSWPPSLRFLPDHPAMKSDGGRFVELHRGPCMVAGVQDAAGKVTAVHQTWLDPDRLGKKARISMPDGSAAPSKMVRGSKKGGAIRLSPLGTSGVMIMGEGIETTATAISAGVMPAATFWAGIDLGNMAGRQVKLEGKRHSGLPDMEDERAWVPPSGIARLYFIQDGDSDPRATRAKLLSGIRRAARLRPGLQGFIVPAAAGKDLNDMRVEQIENDETGQ